MIVVNNNYCLKCSYWFINNIRNIIINVLLLVYFKPLIYPDTGISGKSRISDTNDATSAVCGWWWARQNGWESNWV